MRISNSLAALHHNTALVKQQQDTEQSARDKQLAATSRVTLGKQATQTDSYAGVVQGEVLRERYQGGAVDIRARVLQGEAISPYSASPALARRAIDQFLQAQPASSSESESPRRHIDVYA